MKQPVTEPAQAGTPGAADLRAKITRDRANLKTQLGAIHARAVQREIAINEALNSGDGTYRP